VIVAATTGAPTSNDRRGSRYDEVVDRSIREFRDGARWDMYFQRLAPGTRAQSPFPMTTATRLHLGLACQRLKVAQRSVTNQQNVAAAAAIAAVGTTAGYVRLTAEREATVAATPSLRKDASLIVNHRPQNIGPADRAA